MIELVFLLLVLTGITTKSAAVRAAKRLAKKLDIEYRGV